MIYNITFILSQILKKLIESMRYKLNKNSHYFFVKFVIVYQIIGFHEYAYI